MVILAAQHLTQADVAEIVIRLLAEEHGVSEEEMRGELEETGADLPVDSFSIAEILALVEAECGLRLPLDAKLAQSMRSVTAFSAVVADEIAKVCEP